MNKPLPAITESPEFLQKQLRAEPDANRRRRLQALYLLANGQATSRLNLAQMMGVHRRTVGAWLMLYAAGGLQALQTMKQAPSKVGLLSPSILADLQAQLKKSRGVANCNEIQQYLAREHNVYLSDRAVQSLVRYRLQTKPRKPRSFPSPQRRTKTPASSTRTARERSR